MYKFAPAWEQETIVFGASRSGYTDNQVYDWIEFMKFQNIRRVCCLLSEKQLANYAHLLDTYWQEYCLICRNWFIKSSNDSLWLS